MNCLPPVSKANPQRHRLNAENFDDSQPKKKYPEKKRLSFTILAHCARANPYESYRVFQVSEMGPPNTVAMSLSNIS
jgi:hypothetical protein